MKKINIAFDGPAASGKTTVAISVAKKLGWLFVDTGAMYRAVTWLALKNNIDISDKDSIIKLANDNPVILKQDFSLPSGCRVYIADNDITTEIKSAGVNKNVSDVAKISEVRKCLVSQQKKMAENGGVIMVGRDITTVVMPNAELKIYLDASVEERAKRRFKEEKNLGRDVSFDDIKKSIENRDKIDSEREDSPLKASDDSIVLDSTNMTAEQVIDEVIKLVKNIENK